MCFPKDIEPAARWRWWTLRFFAPLLIIAGAIAGLELTDLDAVLLEPFYDRAAGRFPLRKDWFFRVILHDGGKWLVLVVTALLALLVIASIRLRSWRRWSGQAAYLVVCVATTSGIVSWLKDITNRYPPWDLDRYGGKVPWTPLFTAPPAPFTDGHGFPGGHSSAAFAWVALYFVARANGVPRPSTCLLPGLLLGASFGWVQHVRGAHFPSHNLWSLAIAWCVAVGFAVLFTARGWLPTPTIAAVGADLTPPSKNIGLRSWLAGVSGLIAGSTVFAIDTVVETLKLGPTGLHFWIECIEFGIIGPGMGMVCLLVAERLRIARAAVLANAQGERERRFLVLGRMAAAVAHEVRNPLHTLRLIEDELRNELPALRDHPLRAKVDANLERIDRAVDLVYQLARPNADDEAAVDLVAALREAVAAVALRRPADVAIPLEGLDQRALVRCSPSGLRMVLDNLLRNAVEAAGDSERVDVRLVAEGDSWAVSIANPGSFPPGIVDGALSDMSGSRKAGGLGLGLAISRHIVANAGGTLTLHAGAESVRVDLRLPACRLAQP